MIGSVELVQSTGPIFKTLLFLLHSKSFLKSFLHHIPNLGGFERGSQWKAQIVGREVPHSTSQNPNQIFHTCKQAPKEIQSCAEATKCQLKSHESQLKCSKGPFQASHRIRASFQCSKMLLQPYLYALNFQSII